MSNSAQFFISGEPATFATAGEKPWKEQVARQTPSPTMNGAETGVQLDFVVPGLLKSGRPFDLDNLCEPVFSAVINGRRWFDGSRTKIRWWHATRTLGTPSGCGITMHGGGAPRLPEAAPLVSAVFNGPCPSNAQSAELATWASSHAASVRAHGVGPWALYLGFGNASVNLGDIATGRVKACVDCLYPWTGGVAGAPNDHTICSLAVEKATPGLTPDELLIKLWALAERKAATPVAAQEAA